MAGSNGWVGGGGGGLIVAYRQTTVEDGGGGWSLSLNTLTLRAANLGLVPLCPVLTHSLTHLGVPFSLTQLLACEYGTYTRVILCQNILGQQA